MRGGKASQRIVQKAFILAFFFRCEGAVCALCSERSVGTVAPRLEARLTVTRVDL